MRASKHTDMMLDTSTQYMPSYQEKAGKLVSCTSAKNTHGLPSRNNRAERKSDKDIPSPPSW